MIILIIKVIIMELETLNPYVMKIIISAQEQDSINAIASRIGLSYGWAYKWVNELVYLGVFKLRGKRLHSDKENPFYRTALKFIKSAFSNDISFRYSVLQLFGISYCFTEIDSVFIWTKGGYNISRYKGHYPIFIKVSKDDYPLLIFYLRKLGFNNKKGVYYDIRIVDEVRCEFVDGIPVDPLKDTIDYMKRYIYNFQPALEMVEEMYPKEVKTGIKYKEAVTNV